MQQHYLKSLFSPSSIAVIGASDRANSVGMKVFKNLIHGKFDGKLYPVNPKHKEVQGYPCFPSVKDIKEPIDLAVITTPAKTVPNIISECGEKGIPNAIIISAGFSETGTEGKKLEESLIENAKRHNLHFIGPNCLGMMNPHNKMNVTFDNNFALPGPIALVSQSGALCSGILDWAVKKEIGFSAIVSLGNSPDLDFGDILDYLALDQNTQSILLYIEGVHDARRFLSGLRAASRMKPVIAIKAGRRPQGSRAALSHTGALIGDDDVFDVALRRAGAVRVMTIEELFLAAEILASDYNRVKGNRLAIITNGGGAGVMAADYASDLNIVLPSLDEKLTSQLNQVLPANWSHQNPVDIIGDATPERYHATLDILSKDENVDGLLTILIPVSMAHPSKVAKQVIQDAKQSDKPILACWMGEKHVKLSWKLFEKNKIPYFDTPEKAVRAFSYLADYQFNQQLLLQVPEAISRQPTPDITKARAIIDSALAENRTVLTALESKAILKAFAIPVSETIPANNKDEAISAAEKVGFPLAMKINSPDITHKQDVGGVQLNIINQEGVKDAFDHIIQNAKKNAPQAKIFGVTLERMMNNPNDRELLIGVVHDKVFGPVISFGAGGSLVEIMKDRALALPPLNQFIAEQLIQRTRISKMLGAFRNRQPVNLDTIITILLRVSEMVCELPFIQEMDINPLIINENEAIVVDARIIIAQVTSTSPYSHMAIHPYPNHLVSSWQLTNGTKILIRPIRPEDAEIEQKFIRKLSPQTKYFRFMEYLPELTPVMLVRFSQIDYDCEMALIATQENGSKEGEEILGIAHYATNPDKKSCEFGLVVADAWQNKGVGFRLMTCLMDVAKHKGLERMMGLVLATNSSMLDLAEHLGFSVTKSEDPSIKMIIKNLQMILI